MIAKSKNSAHIPTPVIFFSGITVSITWRVTAGDNKANIAANTLNVKAIIMPFLYRFTYTNALFKCLVLKGVSKDSSTSYLFLAIRPHLPFPVVSPSLYSNLHGLTIDHAYPTPVFFHPPKP